MEYKLTITKTEVNPYYQDPEVKLGRFVEPREEKYIEKYKTIVTLTEEQWKKVQKAIIECLD